ncbi:hypothetical protein TPA0910_59720 [Streptomyces hygroscopicus subsp. sporocinereus]|uniref:Uncharacterized protein n=1 Tax=Streptomyces hygroscopicus TaxID=1912 RepID=A0ABQ3U7G8_STRHY|nr:hypothetical protein [Streptomyces hygroscopicus]GHJ31539.1 hypothetical protein TPA0910_59720 [Streptomyces hygroscopicus]
MRAPRASLPVRWNAEGTGVGRPLDPAVLRPEERDAATGHSVIEEQFGGAVNRLHHAGPATGRVVKSPCAYTQAGYVFTDTPSIPGPALRGYLRVISRFPERGVRALQEIDELLAVGLFSSEVADEVNLMPRVRPVEGKSVEECLSIARDHIRAALRNPQNHAGQVPQMGREWEDVFPS